MKYRNLGRTGFEVSEMGYGAWGIGGKQWLGGSDDESEAAMKRAIDLGVNLIDTALAYGDGHSEQLVGKVVRESAAEDLCGHQGAAEESHLAGAEGHSDRARCSRTPTSCSAPKRACATWDWKPSTCCSFTCGSRSFWTAGRLAARLRGR